MRTKPAWPDRRCDNDTYIETITIKNNVYDILWCHNSPNAEYLIGITNGREIKNKIEKFTHLLSDEAKAKIAILMLKG